MIEFKNFEYKKEYKELIETFIPDAGNRGLVLIFEKTDENISLSTGDYFNKLTLDEYFFIESSNIKRGLYNLLKTYTGKDLKWGMLVGVNPLKLFTKLIEGYGIEEATSILKNGYYLSEEKIELGFSILKFQNPIRKTLYGKNSIYIDIPFCPSRCSYCSYSTYKIDDNLINDYLKVLSYEIEEVSKRIKFILQSIYIGGGTPSSIGARNLNKLLNVVKENFKNPEELTVEIGRPDTINREILEVLKSQKVDRISINPQSMKDETIKALGRNHSASDIVDSFNLAREYGFNNINMDLIIGLPGETGEDFFNTLEIIKKLKPESVSIHALALKKGSELTQSGYYDDSIEEFQKIRDDFIVNEGYIPYYLYRQKNMYLNIENIGYSKPGKESLYNIAMMEDIQNILGLGLGSTTKVIKDDKILRHMNYRRLKDYVENIEKNIEDKLKLFGGSLDEII